MTFMGSLADASKPYLRNRWYQAAWAMELDSGVLARVILDLPLIFFRTATGIAALLDRCPHRFAPLSAGRLEGGYIHCGYHGLAFDATGRCVKNPHGPITAKMCTANFPVVERHSAVWIWMGEPDQADPGLIPDLSCIDETPESALILIYLPTAANYQLMTDNIMDLSHADYLHPATLGGTMTASKARTFTRDNILVADWMATDCQAPGIFQAKIPLPAKADFWVEVEWHPAAVMKLSAAAVHTGQTITPEDIGIGIHSMTPETAQSTHYFAGAIRRDDLENADLTEMMRSSLIQAFEGEDKPMLEAQQARMGNEEFWSLKPLLLPIDKAAVQARRALDKLIGAEQIIERTRDQ